MAHARFLQVAKSHALMSHVLFRVNDLDEARERVANVFSPHDLRVLATGEALDTRMCHVPIGSVSLNRLDYGATVDVDPGLTRDFFLVMMPLAGVSEVRCGKESVRSNPRWAAVVTPTLAFRMRVQQGCDQIVVKLDRPRSGPADRVHGGHGHEVEPGRLMVPTRRTPRLGFRTGTRHARRVGTGVGERCCR